MDFESESVEDNEVNQDAIHFDDVSRIRTNGTSANDTHHSCAAENAFDAMGSVSAAAKGKDLSGTAPNIPSPLRKGYGLKKWKRIPRDFIKDMNSSEDTSKILKRALSASGNPIKPQLSPTETKQNNEGSVGSITPLRNIGNVDGLALHGSSSNSRFAIGSAFNHGTDSENSEDRSSKSSTAASAPKARYDLNAVLGHVREKNRIKSMNGKSTGGSGQKGNQGKGRVEGSKKARGGGERIKVEKENSQSSIESDSRSSCFVFRQGNVAGASASASASNGNQNERSVTDDGDNSDGAYAGDQQFSEEVETAYRKEDEVEAEDVTQDNLTTNVSFDVKEEKDRNHWSPLNKDPMEESILSLQSAQHALEKEIKKLREIGKDEIRSSSIFNDAEPSSFVFDNLETHKTSLSFQMGTGKAASSSFEVTVLGLTGKVKLLETELEETMAILKSKESRVAELESSINTRNSHKEEVRETDEEFERFFRQRIEAEIEYLAITRAIEKLQCETIIDGEKQVFADEQVEMMNRPKEAESKATTLKKQSCDDVSETKEVSTTRWEVFKVLEQMALVTTAEVCDANPQLIVSGELRALEPIFQIYGRRQVFSGPVVTLKVFEDNVLVREFLEEKGKGRVLVVDGGGSKRCAILGGNPVVQAQNNGWAGIVVNGCVRDVDEINGCDIGVRALASHPMKANKKRVGEKHVPITVGGTRIMDGEWLYADTDGILVSRTELSV